jgi:hypothetical protein
MEKKKTVFKIIIDNSFKNENDETLNDITGDELEKYYDGFDYDYETKERAYFYYNVPEQLVNIVASRIKNYEGLRYKYKQVEIL